MQLADTKKKNDSFNSQKPIQICQVCQEEAHFVCSDCKQAHYCSREHQIQNWRVHKDACKVLGKYIQLKNQNSLQEKRYALRKIYFEGFRNKMFDQVLKIARELVKIQQVNVQTTRIITNQLEYGAAVCLLCKTLITLKREDQASIEMKKYLDQKKHFLQDLRDIPQIPSRSQISYNMKNKKAGKAQDGNSFLKQNQSQLVSPLSQISSNAKDFLDKKLCLIAGIANILNLLKGDCMEYYDIYTTHVQKFFGENSQELSNCFFMIGCYYKQQNQINKAIACFIKAASMRTSKAGDCYLNIGILVKMQGKVSAAVQFLEIAATLKQQEYGENSSQVAEIKECLAHIHSENKNFSAAIRQLEKALKIRSNNIINEKQAIIKKQIVQLYDQIKRHLQSGSIKDANKPQLFSDIKNGLGGKIKMVVKGQNDEAHDQSFKGDQKMRDMQGLGKMSKFQEREDKLLKLSQNFMLKLNKGDTIRLSELQIQLQKCKSDYAMAYCIGKSDFVKSLYLNSKKLFNQMKLENEKLFQYINLEEIMMIPK